LGAVDTKFSIRTGDEDILLFLHDLIAHDLLVFALYELQKVMLELGIGLCCKGSNLYLFQDSPP